MGPLGAAAPLSFVLSAAGAVVAMVSVSFMFAVCVEEGTAGSKRDWMFWVLDRSSERCDRLRCIGMEVIG